LKLLFSFAGAISGRNEDASMRLCSNPAEKAYDVPSVRPWARFSEK